MCKFNEKALEPIKAKAISANIEMRKMLNDKKAASLWEYLLVIAVVCIIGATLISVISGSGGIASLWQQLYNKFQEMVTQSTSTSSAGAAASSVPAGG